MAICCVKFEGNEGTITLPGPAVHYKALIKPSIIRLLLILLQWSYTSKMCWCPILLLQEHCRRIQHGLKILGSIWVLQWKKGPQHQLAFLDICKGGSNKVEVDFRELIVNNPAWKGFVNNFECCYTKTIIQIIFMGLKITFDHIYKEFFQMHMRASDKSQQGLNIPWHNSPIITKNIVGHVLNNSIHKCLIMALCKRNLYSHRFL